MVQKDIILPIILSMSGIILGKYITTIPKVISTIIYGIKGSVSM